MQAQKVVAVLTSPSLQQACHFSAGTWNWHSEWEWKKNFSKEESVRSSFHFPLHSLGWWAQLTAASLERIFTQLFPSSQTWTHLIIIFTCWLSHHWLLFVPLQCN